MKKTISSLILVIMLLSGQTANAQSGMVFSTRAEMVEYIQNQIYLIMQEIIELQRQLSEIIAQRNNTGSAAIPIVKEEIIPEPKVETPQPKKEVLIKSNCFLNAIYERWCNISITYKENGEQVGSYPNKVSSTDQGYFIGSACDNGEPANSDGTQRKGNPLSCYSTRYQYKPALNGSITITAEVNGIKTSSIIR